jgi:hypothetical protein
MAAFITLFFFELPDFPRAEADNQPKRQNHFNGAKP